MLEFAENSGVRQPALPFVTARHILLSPPLPMTIEEELLQGKPIYNNTLHLHCILLTEDKLQGWSND